MIRRRTGRRRRCWWLAGGVLGAVALLAVALRVSPWPGALVIRIVFDHQSGKVLDALKRHPPDVAVTTIADQRYRADDPDATFDVYLPERSATTGDRLPVVVWTHGGAWLSGDKRDAAPYFRLLAAAGYAVVAPNYSLAPRHRYPRPVRQLNDLYAHLQAHAARLHLDPDRIVLAGDSAGAQLSGQMAALITNPSYAAQVGIAPALRPRQLRGVVLNCGIYRMKQMTQPSPTVPKIVGWGTDVTVWAYSGTRDFDDPVLRQMSVYDHVTHAFPATYISGGNGDALTATQSQPLAKKLEGLGVAVTKRFYPRDHRPSLPHEYQFHLDNADGRQALRATIAFLDARTRPDTSSPPRRDPETERDAPSPGP